MALVTTRTDDLTGEPDAVTVRIIVGDEGVEVDLAGKSVEKLTKALEPYFRVGSPYTYVVTKRPTRKSSSSRSNGDGPGYDREELRLWADANGVTLPSRGRVPKAILEHYFADQ